ncbi:MAG: nucleotide sugar dehydrogenase [Rhodospirillales bacterium]|nr:MAG: nucleotide sugar dehydrogenase [Rhodospirillales bacterium]
MASDHGNHGRRISVVGLGYVGLPVAVAFGRTGVPVVAFDVDAKRVQELRDGIDRTHEVEPEALRSAALHLTSDAADLAAADFHIVAVPTPITNTKRPDLTPLLSATRTVAQHLKRGDIVVFESTVYPGATEEDCVPILESVSGLTFGRDFTVGYSPERINPGDKVHRFETITKVVSGSDAKTLDTVARVYGSVVEAGVHPASSVRVAEAAKVIENTQRDLNIALMNELALIFARLGIDTQDVLKAAGTKWNFLPFSPGLVGGHCIGVDPYYLTHRAQRAGYHPEVILAGRRINDGMGAWVASETVKRLLRSGCGGGGPLSVSVLGVTFKEDVPDTRNTRVTDIIAELQAFGVQVEIHDPLADAEAMAEEYNLQLTALEDMAPADAVILAVPHHAYRVGGWPMITARLKNGRGFVADVRCCLDRTATPEGVDLWRL